MDVYNPTKNEWDKIPSMNQVNLQTCQHWKHRLVLLSGPSVIISVWEIVLMGRAHGEPFPGVISLRES